MNRMEAPLSGMEAPLNKVEVPLSGLRPPVEVFLGRVDLLRIGDVKEKMEILWRVERQKQLLLLLMIFHMQFLRMFSSLNRTW